MRRSHYLLSYVLSRLFFLILEVAVVIVFAYITFGFRVHGSWLGMAFLLLLGALTFSGVGLLVAARPKTIEGFTLTDQGGQPFSLSNLQGKASLVFFGFTHCPDVCPTTLLKLAQIKKTAAVKGLQVVFITVDPARDTTQLVGAYVHAFDPTFIGLTGGSDLLSELVHTDPASMVLAVMVLWAIAIVPLGTWTTSWRLDRSRLPGLPSTSAALES